MHNIIYYTVQRIDGDYAILVTDEGISNPVARALLPPDCDEGTKLSYQFPNYEIL